MPPPSSTAYGITLPWVEPMVPPLGGTPPTDGILAMAMRPPGAMTYATIMSNANRDAWATIVPELLTTPDAVSVGLGLNESRDAWRLYPVRLHELPDMLEVLTVPRSSELDQALTQLRLPVRLHPCARALAQVTSPLPRRTEHDLQAVVTHQAAMRNMVGGNTVLVQGRNSRQVHEHWHKPEPIFWPAGSDEPAAGKVYVGFEFEASFPSVDARHDRILHALFAVSDQLNPPLSTSRLQSSTRWMPRLHVEHDGSVDSGYEIVTMPHELGHPDTSVAMKSIFGELMALEAHNRTNCCGMHMHMSRTILQRVHGPIFRDIDWLRAVIHRYSALVLMAASRVPRHYRFLTGRKEEQFHARADLVLPSSGRYHHINWANEHTIEFRWPGPLKFTRADWPLIVADLCHAMVVIAARVKRQSTQQTGSRSAIRVGAPRYVSSASNADMDWAIRSLQRTIAAEGDQFPFAYEYFFNNPAVPSGFIISH